MLTSSRFSESILLTFMRQNSVIASITDMLLQAQCIEHIFSKIEIFCQFWKRKGVIKESQVKTEASFSCGHVAADTTVEISFWIWIFEISQIALKKKKSSESYIFFLLLKVSIVSATYHHHSHKYIRKQQILYNSCSFKTFWWKQAQNMSYV